MKNKKDLPVPELSSFDYELLRLVSSLCRGAGQALPVDRIAVYLPKVDRRTLRASHERLVANLYPIGVSECGYFYELTPADRRITRHYRLKKVIGILRSEKRAAFAFDAERQRQLAGRVQSQPELFPARELAGAVR